MARDEKEELLKGTLDMLILQTLTLQPMHGYAIAQHIERLSGDVLAVEQGSLYPALERLQKKGWPRRQPGGARATTRSRPPDAASWAPRSTALTASSPPFSACSSAPSPCHSSTVYVTGCASSGVRGSTTANWMKSFTSTCRSRQCSRSRRDGALCHRARREGRPGGASAIRPITKRRPVRCPDSASSTWRSRISALRRGRFGGRRPSRRSPSSLSR